MNRERDVSDVVNKIWKGCLIFLLLLTLYHSLFIIVTGCGKKAPPIPPKENTWVEEYR